MWQVETDTLVGLIVPPALDAKGKRQRPDQPMQLGFDFLKTANDDPVARYLYLTRKVMPGLAFGAMRHWPVRDDHCFQRIVLDAICQGVWYTQIARPACTHLTSSQALQAVELCEDIIAGKADLAELNRQSLAWRGKTGTASDRRSGHGGS